MLPDIAPVEVVYFEMNNWFSERDYPNEEPFITWFSHDLNLWFEDEAWVKANKLCVVTHLVDMATNFLVTAPLEWVNTNCHKLLTNYTQFLRSPDKDGKVYGQFGTHFLKWSLANIGVHRVEYDYWKDQLDEGEEDDE